MTTSLHALPGRRAWGALRCVALPLLLFAQAGAALAIEIGPLVLRRDIPPGLLGQFRVYDRDPIEASQFTIRLAHADAYTALGLKYERALGSVGVSIEPTMDSGLTVLLRPLPAATSDNRPLDIVVVIFEGMRLTTRLFRVDLRSSSNEFAGVDPSEPNVATAMRAVPRGAPSPTLPTAVAVAAAAPKASAAAARPTPVVPAASSSASAEVSRAVERWAKAWSERQVDAYAAAYAAEFRGTNASHAEWLAFRRARILARREIEVNVSELAVSIDGARAEVRFVQQYRGDQTRLTDRKRLILMRNAAGAWLIQEEATL